MDVCGWRLGTGTSFPISPTTTLLSVSTTGVEFLLSKGALLEASACLIGIRKYLHVEASTWRATDCQFRRLYFNSDPLKLVLSKRIGAWMETPYLLPLRLQG